MRLSYDEIRADNARMEKFICERISGDVTRIDLGEGAWADLFPSWDTEYGWSLLIETDEPEWVDLWEVYQHFRRKEMTTWEWWQEFDREMARGKIFDLEREVAVLRKGRSDEVVSDIGESLPSQGRAKDMTLVSDIRHQLTEINAKLDGLDDIRERIALQEDDPSFTVAQVAQKLQVSSTKVYQLTESGKLRSYKTGSQVRIKASHIREYQDRHTRVAEAKKKRKSGSFDRSEADRLFGPGWDA